MKEQSIDFVDEDKSQAKIMVLGVGGGGGNAAKAMLGSNSEGEVALYAINTDAQALEGIGDGCGKVQIGYDVTKGLGVGAKPKIAEEAAIQDISRIEEIVDGSDMVFIAAGMGGGTGTGASPVIAQKCKEMGILTVAVVTKPFNWENRDKNAALGIENLSSHVDSIIVIPNDKIAEVHGSDLPIKQAFAKCDEILSNAVTGICEVIHRHGLVNVDFADVKTVMSETGQAMMGFATEEGVDRATRAAAAVIDCPLLEGVRLENARGLLVNVTANTENFRMSELNEIMEQIRKPASSSAQVFFGCVDNADMGDSVRITLIATGLRNEAVSVREVPGTPQGLGRVAPALLASNRRGARGGVPHANQGSLLEDDRNIPTILRRQQS